MNVDWRTRYGRRWITSVRDQGSSQNCWAFAATALYEAMIRIEHNLWTRRSEGDCARGTGKQAWNLGNIGEATIFVERYGLADPDCFPWSEAVSLYTSKPHGASMVATPLSPTPDRAGRTMRVAAGSTVSITDVAAKKTWINLVGPMAVLVNPPSDFGQLHDGIYTPTSTTPGGMHALLVVGFSDDEQCWIVKNSWGTTWGVGGYGRFAYDSLLDPAEFIGVRNTNPDPWSRRRLRTGALIQGGNGASRNNFELFIQRGTTIEHWYRENAVAAQPWSRVRVISADDPYAHYSFRDDALDCPAAVQSSFNRNYELVYRGRYNGQLRHVYFDQSAGWWFDATLFGPPDPVGMPGFVQRNRGAPGDFEVVVVTQSGQAQHWTKHNSAPWTRPPGQWYQRGVVGTGIGFGGPSLVQSKLGLAGVPENGRGELHYVATLTGGQMRHFRRSGGRWRTVATFGAGATSGPCLIEGTYGAGDDTGVGNFELCVTVGEQIEHWWRHNASLSDWSRGAVFGDGVRRVVGLLQGTYATNLELVAERTDGNYQHYWRDGVGWHPGPLIT